MNQSSASVGGGIRPSRGSCALDEGPPIHAARVPILACLRIMCSDGESSERNWKRGASRDENSTASDVTRRAISRGWSNGASSYFCHPRKKGRPPRRRRLKGGRGRGTLAKEKPPIFGMIQRTGMVVIRMLENVKQVTIAPLIQSTIATGSVVYTDEYDIYARLSQWGYGHRTVCHAAGEFARDEDGDGFCEVHVNTIEGFWSLLRSWLCPHRGVSQEKLPLYLGFFEFAHNVRKRGKALLGALISLLVR